MVQSTKALILEQHHHNPLLNASAPPLMARTAHDLSADEVFAPLDERMIAGAIDALEAGQTHYVDVPGIAPLRAALADYLRTGFNATYAQSNVIVTAGMQESRFLTIQMIGDTFGRIAVPTVAHPGVRKALGVRALNVELIEVDERALPTLDSLKAVLSAGTRLAYLESPARLTGAAFTAAEVAAIAELAREYEATIIWDQGLAPWTVEYTSLASMPGNADRTVVIGETFPGMGLSSWFIGYIAAPEPLVAPMQSQKQIMAICTSTAAQYAALEASKLYAEALPVQRDRLAKLRDAVIAAISSAQTVIPGASVNVLALRLPAAAKAAALARLTDAGYSAVDGADFGAPDVLRLTISAETRDALAHSLQGA
ncbi:MAG: aminotransferase class I/II-fold pyridoxal phosphate-dependent enzyme [Anaerolineae bacterium]|nr:aminotransferase class I/II-fold pyridoxal phosphate-dependent enzyme [Anaerolineae bacterium]